MSYIKGQNLRVVLWGSSCIAAAKTCTLSVNATISDHSTKDTTGNFADNEVDNLSWEVTTESLITDGYIFNGAVKCTQSLSDTGLYSYPEAFNMCYRDKIYVSCADPDVTLYIFDSDNNQLATGTGVGITYTVTDEEKTVGVIASSNTADVDIRVEDNDGTNFEDLKTYMEDGTKFGLSLEPASGSKNRTTQGALLEGTAIVTAISLNSPNRQDSTMTATFTGVGDLINQM